ncbi:MAG: hypothetical protein Q9168_001369 [Polycauliona sp. 1 TL-2023]
MPRSSGVRNSPIGSSQADGEGLNSDYCSSCGGPGELLCCDSCPRAFHFTCIDPPKHTLPDGEWYCQACAAQPSPPPTRGIFPILLHALERKNPRAFTLRPNIREFFEDVITGDDGEYEEAGPPPSKAKTRTGCDVPVDTLRLRDPKDNIILCYACDRSAMGRREIISCDYCSLYWHLDCVDPPLATAPKQSGKHTWKCPNHVDAEVAVPRSSSGKSYRPRKVRHPRVITSALRRGIRNSGHIEIVNDEVDEYEELPAGAIHKIHGSIVELDFISKVKQLNKAAARARQHESAYQHAVDDREVFRGRTAAEREAAVNLARFAQNDANSQLTGERLGVLVCELYANAPAEVNGLTNGNHHHHTYGQANGDDPFASTNGDDVAMEDAPRHSNAASANEAAYAANHVRSVGTPPSADPQTLLLAEEEEILRLEAIVQKRKAFIQQRIAEMDSVTAPI